MSALGRRVAKLERDAPPSTGCPEGGLHQIVMSTGKFVDGRFVPNPGEPPEPPPCPWCDAQPGPHPVRFIAVTCTDDGPLPEGWRSYFDEH